MIKILIADDHSIVRKGLRQILQAEFSEIQFGEAGNAVELMKLFHMSDWDMIILDINMPGRNGLEVLKQFKDENIKTPVLVLSMHSEEQIALRVIKTGASGYLSKDTADTELVNAVKQVLSGRKYITGDLAEQLAMQLENPQEAAPEEYLSDREYQTFILIGQGKTVSQIAEELSLSNSTVGTYRARILEKMNMNNNAELINYAVKRGLV